jgi:hypothetical protein
MESRTLDMAEKHLTFTIVCIRPLGERYGAPMQRLVPLSQQRASRRAELKQGQCDERGRQAMRWYEVTRSTSFLEPSKTPTR